MRVGVFLGEFKPDVGGGYTFVNDVAEGFFAVAGESHHQFFLFCPPEAIAVLKKRNLPKNIELVVIATRNNLGRLISRAKHVSPLFNFIWRIPSRLEQEAKRRNVQLLWFVGGNFDTLDIPYIANVWDIQHRTHPWFPEVSAKGVWEWRELFLGRHLRRAARIITGTEVGKKEIMSFYQIPENNITILPHPTPAFALKVYEIDKAAILRKFSLEDGFLLYPAQFWAHKNHMNILLALALLKKQGDKVPDVAFVGSDKGNKGYIAQKAAELAIQDKVHFLGFVSTDDLIGLYKSAGAMLYASFSGPENLPPLEAFALGCPVIASEFPGAREQMGDCAEYFDPHSPEDLAEVIKNFRSDNVRIEKGVIRANKWVGQDYARGVIMIIDGFEAERRCWE